MDVDDLTEADHAILDELTEGARTKKAIVDKTGLHRNTVGNRLDVLQAGEIISCIHHTTALYELVNDPRDRQNNTDAEVSFSMQTVRELEHILDELEQGFDHGDPERIQDALGRARELITNKIEDTH